MADERSAGGDDRAHESAGKALKRRGILAAAAAVVAGIVAKSNADSSTVSANTGDFLTLGSTSISGVPNNSANATTGVTYTGASLANADIFSVADFYVGTRYPAAVGGYAIVNTVQYGVHGFSNTAGKAGVLGEGIAANSNMKSANGVVGMSESGSGVVGTSASGNGVYGTASVAATAGVFGQTGTAGAVGVTGYSTVPTGYAGLFNGKLFATNSADHAVVATAAPGFGGVFGQAYTGNGSAAILGSTFNTATNTNNTSNYAGFFNGNLTVVRGNKNVAVPHPDGSYRLLYCVEATEAWFEDFGTGTLIGGKADVALDPDFATTIHTDDYHVFLTGLEEHHHVIVKGKQATGFTVEADMALAALKGKKASDLNGTFSYRIVGKRKDVEGKRLAKATLPEMKSGEAPKMTIPPAPPTPPAAPPKKP